MGPRRCLVLQVIAAGGGNDGPPGRPAVTAPVCRAGTRLTPGLATFRPTRFGAVRTLVLVLMVTGLVKVDTAVPGP